MTRLSICISCFSPSKGTLENLLIIEQELKINKDVELVYFNNGSEKKTFGLPDLWPPLLLPRLSFSVIEGCSRSEGRRIGFLLMVESGVDTQLV